MDGITTNVEQFSAWLAEQRARTGCVGRLARAEDFRNEFKFSEAIKHAKQKFRTANLGRGISSAKIAAEYIRLREQTRGAVK